MIVRLFTSGQHNGLQFSNQDIDRIYSGTLEKGADKIPVVLGHPKNNLPVMGYVPKKAITKYDEGEDRSIGFDRAAAEFSEESIDALREHGHNKISIRLTEGVIDHVGLVKHPAVKKNADQDFSSLSGTFDFEQNLLEPSPEPDQQPSPTPPNQLPMPEPTPAANPHSEQDFKKLQQENEALRKEKEAAQKELDAQKKAAEDIALASEFNRL